MDFSNLLKTNSVKNNGKQPTHTRIGDKQFNIYGGSFAFDDEDPFYEGLYEHIFLDGKKEYLTEKQLENGTFVIDLDFRYCHDVSTRQHSKEDIENIVYLFNETLKKYVIFDKPFRCYVMEKPNVNILADGSLTKDGIHLFYDFELNDTIKQAVRNDVIKEIPDVIDLPLINSWEDVVDKGVITRACNWNIYGCSKPNNERYEVTDVFEFELDQNDGEFMSTKCEIDFDYNLFQELSVRTRKQILHPNKQGDKIIAAKQRPSSPNSVVPLAKETANKDKFLELLDIIGVGNEKVLHPRWFQIGSILKTNGYSKIVFEEFTKQYVPNKEKELNKIWDYINAEQVWSIYGLQGIAKTVNLGQYNDWFIRHKQYISSKTLCKGNNDIANFISKGLKEVLVYCNKNWIMYDNKINLWRITDCPSAKVCSYIQYLIDCSLETAMYAFNKIDRVKLDAGELSAKTKADKLNETMSIYKLQRVLMADNKQNSMILKFLKDYLSDNEFYIKLDVNKYNVAYKNGMLDLKTLEFREGLIPSDMITQTIPYNYEKGDEQTISKVRLELLKICNNNETHLEYYLSALGYAMTGDSMKLQEFYYIIGQTASNGKSIIFEALNDIIPPYCKKIDSNAFEVKNSQLHKEIASWHGKRIGWINELTTAKQDAELIKQVADGTPIPYKVMYGTTDIMPITFKNFIISNHSPTIDADAGIKRRMKMFQMDSEFIEGLEQDDFAKCRFISNNKFGDLLRTEYKFALMSLIYSYSKKFYDDDFKMSEYPADWNEVKQDTVDDNNPFVDFVMEHFEFGNDFEITEYYLKQYLKTNKLEHIKFADQVKRNRWKLTRDRVKKLWIGFRVKEIIEE
jgi:hypothetical protein